MYSRHWPDRISLAVAIVALSSLGIFLMPACGDNPSSPTRCGVTILSITCSPATDALQCRAAQHDQCNSGTDVTTQAQWQSSDSAVAAVPLPGSVRSVSPGDSQITATHVAATGSMHVRVLPGQPPLLVGDILSLVRRSPGCGTSDGIPGVLVTITSGLNSGLQAVTDERGGYGFPNIAFAPTISLRASKDGYRDVVVNGEPGYPPGIPTICMTQTQ